jgi:predicted 3-demethylubiquinone-9 3-methyltransferase (glyoxalase superfamily)
MATLTKITPCLWFDTEGEAAATFYTSVFDNSRITSVTHYGSAGPRPEGMVLTVEFELDGQPFTALNGGPDFSFSEALSLQVNCESQAEVDHFWTKLGDGGEPGPCGWLKDRYGVSWQIVPTRLTELITDPDPERSQRAMKAMLAMGKIDIAEVERAADAA